jgi:hypothetical protein
LSYIFGGILCSLLLLFTVGAKLAPYHPQQQEAKPIAATKAKQNNAIPSADTAIVGHAPSFLNILTVLLSLVFVATSLVSLNQPASPFPTWFSPYLSVRPPPAL